ncbi:transposase InsO family protein [Anoxybacillus calidus]|jgi:transposase InsO family protein|uniref:Transposase InsO family protein n=1 Tax=[Anoxybacillus] calidus TaxID=575178 RepID=A0A7V9Z1J8_9BACL|nr:transposase InsO family protein [Anoxybacillus calidus]
MNAVRGKKQNKRFSSTLNVYTTEKSHSVLGYVSPCEFEAAYYAN